jgi:heme/copper-type cytochrome/quinol oxidase subunit 2
VVVYDDDEWDREEKEDDLINIFLFVLIMSFGIFSLLAGVFTAYFGAGKSRAIGGFLLVIGIVIILIWVYFGIMQDFPDDTILGIVHWDAAKTLEAFLTVLGAIIGALVAVGVFLLAIMKS